MSKNVPFYPVYIILSQTLTLNSVQMLITYEDEEYGSICCKVQLFFLGSWGWTLILLDTKRYSLKPQCPKVTELGVFVQTVYQDLPGFRTCDVTNMKRALYYFKDS